MGTTTSPPQDDDEALYQAAGVRPIATPGAGAEAQAAAPGGFMHGVGLGTRAVVQGALSLPGLAVDVTNLRAPGTSAEKTAQALDALGLPRPQTGGETTTSGAIEGGTGALLMGPEGRTIEAGSQYLPTLLRPYAARVGQVLAASPVAGTVAGTAGGGASGFLAAEGADPLAQALAGTATGALIGLVPGATAGFASAADQALLNDARTRFNIRVAPAQADPAGKWAFSATKDLPFSGGEAFLQGQRNDLNSAAGKLFGAVTDANGKLTQDAINDASAKLANRFSAMATNAAAPPDGPLLNDFTALRDKASRLGDAGNGIVSSIDNFRNVIRGSNSGIIPGDFLAGEVNSKSAASVGARSSDPVARNLWNSYRDAVLDFIGRNPNVDQTDWADAKQMYRNMKVVAPTTNINGDVSPSLLANAANRNERIPGWDRDLSRLGQIGQKYLKEPPQSGTAPRSQVYDLLKEGGKAAAIGLGIGGAEHVSPEAAVGLAGVLGGGSVGGRLMQFGARTPAPDISYPGFVLRNAAITPTQPPIGQEQMSPYWRALMGGQQ